MGEQKRRGDHWLGTTTATFRYPKSVISFWGGPATATRPLPIILAAFLLYGCANDQAITEIRLERKGCLGPCRLYSVTLRRDGSATYVGTKNVERIGTYKNDNFWPVTFEFNRLVDAIAKTGFFRLDGQYAGGTVDAEVVVTTVVKNGQAKTITTHDSSKDPNDLWLVDTLIDGVSAEVQWVKQD